MMRNDESFAEAVRAEVERRMWRKAMAVKSLKNNGIKLTGITVENGLAAPTVYIVTAEKKTKTTTQKY